MDNTQLSAGSGGGTQSTTQNPQVAQPGAYSGIASGNLQSGTAQTLLNSGGGLPLTQGALSTVSLNSTTTASTTRASSQPATPHHINSTLLGLATLLLIMALASFWLINRSANNTTI